MAPKADPKKAAAKKEESESYESEEYEYQTESESSEKKPAAKKDDAKKADAKKEEAKPAAKAAAKKESSDESEEYEYETETEESSDKKPAAKPAVDAKKTDAKPAVAAAAKPAAAKKTAESESEEYEYESEYETESQEKKPAAAASKPADTKTAAAPKSGDTKAVAATTTKATTTTTTTSMAAATSGGTTTVVVAQREVVVAKPHSLIDDPAHPWAPKNFVAEFLGTFIFAFVVYMTRMDQAVVGPFQGAPLGGLVSQALVQAFALIAVTSAFGRVSGGHFNPAVTCFMIFTRQVHFAIGLIYIFVQLAGGILAGALAWGLEAPAIRIHAIAGAGTGFAAPITCTLYPTSQAQSMDNETVNGVWACWPQAFGAEIMGTAIFILIYGMVWVSGHGGLGAIAVGLALGMLVFAYEDISNAMFNPARALGSAAFAYAFNWWSFWVYIIGPFIGALIATVIWGLMYQSAADRSIGHTLIHHPKN